MYLALLGISSQLWGIALPRGWFKPHAFPYRSYKWEKDGKVYEKIKIKKWKTKLPDASRATVKILPKRINSRPDSERALLMAKETCVAENVHCTLSVFGFGCVLIWRGVGGITVSVLYALGNLPFILIQRYNRPRHLALAEHIKKTKANNGDSYEFA